MQLEIVSPERVLLSADAESITLPGIDGKFQILNNHAPIVSILSEGYVNFELTEEIQKKYKTNFTALKNKQYTLKIEGGVLEMNNNKVIVLVD